MWWGQSGCGREPLESKSFDGTRLPPPRHHTNAKSYRVGCHPHSSILVEWQQAAIGCLPREWQSDHPAPGAITWSFHPVFCGESLKGKEKCLSTASLSIRICSLCGGVLAVSDIFVAKVSIWS